VRTDHVVFLTQDAIHENAIDVFWTVFDDHSFDESKKTFLICLGVTHWLLTLLTMKIQSLTQRFT
jgi:hypothetical protein